MQLALILATVLFYLVSCVWGLTFLYRPGGFTRPLCRLFVVLGLLAHTTLGLLRWQAEGQFPVTQIAESMWLLVWFLVLAIVVTDYVYGLPTLGPLLLLLVVLLSMVGLLLGRPGSFEAAAWTPAHVVAVVLGFAGFAVAAISSVLYLFQERSLKTKAPDGLPGVLPSLETLDRVNFHALGFGFALLTVGLSVGLVAAIATSRLGSSWWWDSKVVMSALLWAFYAAVMVCRLVRSLRGRPIARLTVVGFVLVVVTLVGTDLVVPGVHARQGEQSGRLDRLLRPASESLER